MKDIFLLDMDDTLLDFGRTERENLLGVLARFSLPATEQVAVRFHQINDALWKALERGEVTRPQIAVRRFEQLFFELGVVADIPAVAKAYMEGFCKICHPFAGAEEFVRTLSGMGRVYIVTNGASDVQRAHLSAANFLPYVAGVFISDEMGANKPSQEYVRQVMDGIENFSAARAVFVGDSMTSDRVCAARMGVDFILYGSRRADMLCALGYDEALALIRAM